MRRPRRSRRDHHEAVDDVTNLDALLAGGHALTANHTAVDYLINTGLLYGPGVLATAAAVTVWRTCRWAIDCRQARIDRRHYTARAFRLNRVADRADAVMALPEDQLIAQLNTHYATKHAHTHEGEK